MLGKLNGKPIETRTLASWFPLYKLILKVISSPKGELFVWQFYGKLIYVNT